MIHPIGYKKFKKLVIIPYRVYYNVYEYDW